MVLLWALKLRGVGKKGFFVSLMIVRRLSVLLSVLRWKGLIHFSVCGKGMEAIEQ